MNETQIFEIVILAFITSAITATIVALILGTRCLKAVDIYILQFLNDLKAATISVIKSMHDIEDQPKEEKEYSDVLNEAKVQYQRTGKNPFDM